MRSNRKPHPHQLGKALAQQVSSACFAAMVHSRPLDATHLQRVEALDIIAKPRRWTKLASNARGRTVMAELDGASVETGPIHFGRPRSARDAPGEGRLPSPWLAEGDSIVSKDENFKSAGYDWRLHCGKAVIESDLRGAVERLGAKRAFVVCSPSIRMRTDTVARIETVLGDRYAGVFDQIEKDSTYASVCAGVSAAEDARADVLIAVGGGSVIVATRAIAIFLAEVGSPLEIMTQYPAVGRPYSPKLVAPKLPIINVPTTPTSAMNRAGTGLKNPDLDHRMEYFDPKTRPKALFIDYDALLTTPKSVLLSTATTVFTGLVGGTTRVAPNPLVEGDTSQAFKLGFHAYRRLVDDPVDPILRRDLCLSSFLSNRAEDDGQSIVGPSPFASNYAVSTALHLYRSSIGQGESSCVVHASAIRLAKSADLDAARMCASALGIWKEGMTLEKAVEAVASELESIYAAAGMPTRLRDLKLTPDDLPKIAAETVKNFNALGGMTTADERVAASLKLLETAW